MKANRSARAGGDEGVSSVVAAVLLVALFTTAFTLWTVTTLPEWIADREQAHANAVRGSFSAAAAALDSLSAAGDDGPVVVPVRLGAEPVPLIQSTPSTGQLGVQGTVTAEATFTGESLLFADGVAVGEPDDDVDEGAGDFLPDVVDLRALAVRLTTANVGNDDEAWISVVADDGDDTVTALVTHAGKPSGSGPNEAGCLNSELRLEVITDVAPLPVSTSTQALLCELADDLTGYSLDLASNFYPFLEAVQRLDTPYSLTLSDGSSGGSSEATGAFAASYIDSSGVVQGAGSGEAVDYELSQRGARLLYEPAYRNFARQDMSWEFGATVISQDDGMVVLGPSFTLSVADGVGSLDWSLVETDGEGSHAGRGDASVRVTHDRTTDLVLTAAGASFTLTTPSAAAWRSFFATEILVAGAGSDVTVGGTGDEATLTFTSTTVSDWRMRLRLVEATVEVV